MGAQATTRTTGGRGNADQIRFYIQFHEPFGADSVVIQEKRGGTPERAIETLTKDDGSGRSAAKTEVELGRRVPTTRENPVLIGLI